MPVVRAPNILCSVIFAVVPYLASTTEKKTQNNKTTHTKKPTQHPQLFEMEFTPTADSASQSAAMLVCQ